MARTKQTARKTCIGMAPRFQLGRGKVGAKRISSRPGGSSSGPGHIS